MRSKSATIVRQPCSIVTRPFRCKAYSHSTQSSGPAGLLPFSWRRSILETQPPNFNPSAPGHVRKLAEPRSQGRLVHAPARTRTWNLLIKSQLLYQLSYEGKALEPSGLVSRFQLTGSRAQTQWLARGQAGAVHPGTPRNNDPGGRRLLSAPGRTRTCDQRIRNPLLYPPELRAPWQRGEPSTSLPYARLDPQLRRDLLGRGDQI